MIDEYLQKDEVTDLINRIKTSPKYNTKTGIAATNYYGLVDKELSLYILYDALLKYKIIVDDKSLFKDYIEQLDKLLKKIDDYGSILVGVNKLICYIVSKYLKITDLSNEESRKKIISYIYDKYILDGYYVHGFNSTYEKSIKENGFISEVYINRYNEMNKVKEIFKKRNFNIIEKDFTSNKTFFTDDFIMGCYYSAFAPGYFSKIFFNETVYSNNAQKENYLKQDYDLCSEALKKFLNSKNFNDEEKKYIISIINSEWNYLNSEPKKISLLLVSRKKISNNYNPKLEDYINDNSNIYEIIDKMLNPKYNKISFGEKVSASFVNVISLDNFYDNFNGKLDKEEEINLESKQKISKENQEFLDSYGKVYIFLILGSLLVSLGVIISLIITMRGI